MNRLFVVAAAVMVVSGCGSTSPVGPVDGGADGGTIDVLPDGGSLDAGVVDAGVTDAGSDCSSGLPCAAGLICRGAACMACSGAADDAACAATWGAGNICVAGACVAGTCHDSATCGGRLCDAQTHACVDCASTAQCTADSAYGATATCNVALGSCAPCDVAADGMTFHVNPVEGNDLSGNGGPTTAGVASPRCAFKSLTKALAAATTAARQNMRIVVDVSGTATAATGETFPLTLPAGTTVAAATGAAVVLQLAAGDAFHLSNANTTLRGLVLDGQGTAANGVVVSAAGTVLSGVEVKGFATAGVRAADTAVLSLTASTNLHHDGIGLQVVGTAQVTVDGVGATEAAPTQLSTNTGNGIDVRGQGRVNISGTPSTLTPGQGTVVVRNNAQAGLFVQQLLVAEGSAGPAGMTVTGLVSTLNGASGLHVFGGSGVKVRGSYLSRNSLHGVFVQTNPAFVNGGSGANTGNDLTRIDLGAAGDFGHNVLSDASNPNVHKGVCVDLSTGSSTGGAVKLQGNVFATGGSSVDCAQIAGSLPATNDCTAQGPLGDVGRNPNNDLDVAQCTIP